jgi:hypothetical protein
MDSFPETEKRWFMHVGYLAQNWAAVELMLDGIARQLHVHYGGEKLERSPPQPFTQKKKFLRRAFGAHPKLRRFSSELNTLLETATRLAEIRHWTLHAGWADTQADAALLRRYRREDPLRLEQQSFSLEEIYSAATECATLAFSLNLFAQEAFGLRTRVEIEQLLSDLSSQINSSEPSEAP